MQATASSDTYLPFIFWPLLYISLASLDSQKLTNACWLYLNVPQIIGFSDLWQIIFMLTLAHCSFPVEEEIKSLCTLSANFPFDRLAILSLSSLFHFYFVQYWAWGWLTLYFGYNYTPWYTIQLTSRWHSRKIQMKQSNL